MTVQANGLQGRDPLLFLLGKRVVYVVCSPMVHVSTFCVQTSVAVESRGVFYVFRDT